jgi:hypothetical protein
MRTAFTFVEQQDPRSQKIFSTPEELKRVYYPKFSQLIKSHFGREARARLSTTTLRSGDQGEREAELLREPVLSAHNDYTEWSGPNPGSENDGGGSGPIARPRFAIIQVWRAINQPIQSNPLAIADAKQRRRRGSAGRERRYPHRVGQTYRLKYNPRHRWFYFPRMRRDEALVFKVFDSEKDGRARFTPHTSFVDPATPPGAPPRQSIEAARPAFF